MPESSLPPSPPTTNNTGLLIGGALIALLGVGGAVFALRGEDAPKPEVPVTVTSADTGVRAAPPPPPPPPEEEPSANAAPTAPATTTAKSAAGSAADNRGPSGCSGTCTGSAEAGLREALRQRGASAKGCYNKALRSNPTLQGKMTVAVRVSPTGNACSASASNNTLGDASVTTCILQQFRSGAYPKPTGGCVDVQVPLNFVPGG
jgi:hypothetical protein